jgi:hypothetical protein
MEKGKKKNKKKQKISRIMTHSDDRIFCFMIGNTTIIR